MITNQQFEEMERCRADLTKALHGQMKHRHEHSGLGWIIDERYALLAAANKWAADYSLDPLDLEDIEASEMMAVGHSDYSHKFVLYVSEHLYDLR